MNRDVATIPKRIASIKFSLMDPNEIRKMSAVEVRLQILTRMMATLTVKV